MRSPGQETDVWEGIWRTDSSRRSGRPTGGEPGAGDEWAGSAFRTGSRTESTPAADLRCGHVIVAQ